MLQCKLLSDQTGHMLLQRSVRQRFAHAVLVNNEIFALSFTKLKLHSAILQYRAKKLT